MRRGSDGTAPHGVHVTGKYLWNWMTRRLCKGDARGAVVGDDGVGRGWKCCEGVERGDAGKGKWSGGGGGRGHLWG